MAHVVQLCFLHQLLTPPCPSPPLCLPPTPFSLPRFKELRDYVLARRDALGGGGGSKGATKEPSIMDLDLDDATALKKSGKGFA